MCLHCLDKTPTLRKTFDAIARLTSEPRFADGVRPLDLAAPLGFETVPQLAASLGALRQAGAKRLEAADANLLCDLCRSILEHATRPATLHRSAQRVLAKREAGDRIEIRDATQLYADLKATVKNTIEQRVSEIRQRLRTCPDDSQPRLTITERRYRIVPAEGAARFDAGRLLPLLGWMSRPAWRNPIGSWEKLALKTVHVHFRHGVTTGILLHDNGTGAGEIPRLDSIPSPAARAGLCLALVASEKFSRIIDLFFETRGDDLVLRRRAAEHGQRVAQFLSAARLLVVDTVNGLLAGRADPIRPDAHLGMFPHRTESVRVRRMTPDELEAEFAALFQLGLDLWFDEEKDPHPPGFGPCPADGGVSSRQPC